MTYVLATTENIMRWYRCELDKDRDLLGFDLLSRLDLKKVSVFGDKPFAEYTALKIGLKIWRYVKF